jgi:hypothetical protein
MIMSKFHLSNRDGSIGILSNLPTEIRSNRSRYKQKSKQTKNSMCHLGGHTIPDTILKRAGSSNFKMVCPPATSEAGAELDGQYQVQIIVT